MSNGPQWDQACVDTVLRIKLLQAAFEGLKPDEARDMLMRDLILPNLRLIAAFNESVSADISERKVIESMPDVRRLVQQGQALEEADAIIRHMLTGQGSIKEHDERMKHWRQRTGLAE